MKYSRRNFMQRASCATVSAVSASSALFDLVKTAAAASPASQADYKALVCVFLYGGNDGHNMLIPRTAADYNVYATGRTSLAIPQAQLLPLTYKDAANREFGLHPNLPEVRTLFNNKNLAVVANVGPLVVPITKADYKSKLKPLPPQLFSHSDQQVHWQTSWPDQIARTGWGGRLADAVNSLNSAGNVSMNISLGGINTLQVGEQVSQYVMQSEGPLNLSGFDPNPQTTSVISQSVRGTFYPQQPQANLFEEAWNGTMRTALDTGALFRTALSAAPALTTKFPTDSFGKQLNMVAKLIGVRNTLGLRRQIFFTTLDGWDTHNEQLASHVTLLTRLSQGLDAFYKATSELGVANNVTTFTASDFGRSLKANGKGTDHGWGNHQFVMGGAVDGGKFVGTFPSLALDGPDDAGSNGRLIPTTAVDEYAATLATWFGVSNADLTTIFPNLGNFRTRNLLLFK